MPRLRLLDLMDVASAAKGGQLWPRERVGASLGATTGDVDQLFESLVAELDAALEFHAFRPGADPARAGFSAELHVQIPTTRPLVPHTMPDVGIFLEPTNHQPAHVFVTHGPAEDVGLEVVLHGLPIKLALPLGLLAPGYLDDPDGTGVTPVRITAPFDPDAPDSLEIVLSNIEASTIRMRANLRLTRAGDVLLEPVIPISIGPCRFLGVPCQGLHDFQLFPTLRLGHVPESHIRSELPLSWLRYPVERVIAPLGFPSALAVRTVDLDTAWPAYQDVQRRLLERRAASTGEAPSDVEVDAIDLVIEDVVLPLGLGLPLPLHGRFALRRRVLEVDAGDRYNLDTSPARFDLGDTQLVIKRFLVQTQVEGELPAAISTAWVKTDEDLANLDELPSSQMDLTEEPTAEFATVWGEGHRLQLCKVAGATVRVAALRTGILIKNLSAEHSLDEMLFLLADLEIDVPPSSDDASGSSGGPASPDDEDKPIQLRKRGQPSYILLRGLGWKDGPAFGSLYDPDGLDLVVLRGLKLKIEELGLIGAHGARYLSISASVEKGKPDGSGEWSVHLHRLRIRMEFGDPPPGAPLVELDGIELAYRRGPTEILGFGTISDYERDGTRFHEMGFEVRLAVAVLDARYRLGAQYLRGSARGAESFDYWLFGLDIGELSIGATVLHRGQVLLVRNLAPALPEPTGDEPALRLFRWYKSQGDPLSLPLSRKLATWVPRDRALAIGIGATFELAATRTVQLRGFFFYREDDDEQGLLGGLELYLFKAETPAVFLVYEHDFARSRWSLTAGLDLSIDRLLGTDLPHFLDLVHITGSGYFCSQPDTIAIGQYPDPATWLAISFKWGDILEIRLAVCYHRINEPDPADPSVERINAIAFTASLKGGWRLGKIASEFQLYGALDLRKSQWRTEALAAATSFRFEVAVRLKLFGFFRFGAAVKVEVESLGPEGQRYSRRALVIRVETPWWLPDVTIRCEKCLGTAASETMHALVRPLRSAAAIDVAQRCVPIGIAARAGLPDAATHPLTALRDSTPIPATTEDFDALTPICTDAVIALDLGATVEAVATALPPAPAGASHQQSGELHARYELVRFGVRRRARFGPDAGVWRDLVDPVTTQLPPLPDLPGDVSALFACAVKLAWDADATRLGRLDARRLLVNADTPYTLTVGNAANDEDLAAAHPHWPCCLDGRRKPVWHRLGFEGTPAGELAPRVGWFSESRSSLTWLGERPVVAPAEAMPGAPPAAAIVVGQSAPRTVATVQFDRIAHTFELTAAWPAQHSHAVLRIDAYRGATRVASADLALETAVPGTPPLSIVVLQGMTHLVLRKRGAAEATSELGALAPLVAMRYRTVADVLADAVDDARCDAEDERLHAAGMLAWLPNHDYEVSFATRIEIEHEGSGIQDALVEELARFRTKGPPGLNACESIGGELGPYVESVYPRPGTVLYRDEPIALAFDERWSRYTLVDRVLAPTDPAERQQILEWAMAIDHVTSGAPRPVTATAQDWIVAHRGAPIPPDAPPFDGFLVLHVRHVASFEPRWLRLETMAARPGACDAPIEPRASAVMVHAPVPDASGVPAWRPSATYHVNLRAKQGPWVARLPLGAVDATALTLATTSGPAPAWSLTDGALRPEGGAGLAFAELGDSTWDHVAATVSFVPGAGTAGVALGVHGAPFVDRAVYAAVDSSSAGAVLRLVERTNGIERTLGTASVDAAATQLTLFAFDDGWRAQMGDVRVEAPRGDVRAGRAALVARAGGGIRSIELHALDAYRLVATTSRYRSFSEHVGSFSGEARTWEPVELGGASASVADLLAQTRAEVDAVMVPRGSAEQRDRLFERWLDALALPLSGTLDRVEVTRYVVEGVTRAFLVESPEPLPVGDDVAATIRHEAVVPPPHRPPTHWPFPPHRPPHHPPPPTHAIVAVPHAALRNGDETRVLLVPVDAAGASVGMTGPLTIEFELARERFRAPEPDAVLTASATIALS